MNMIYTININNEIILRSVEDLSKLKVLIEVNNFYKPNFSAIARGVEIYRRIVKMFIVKILRNIERLKNQR